MSKWTTYPMHLLSLVPEAAGVYAIYHDGELVYVGMTVNLRWRLCSHAQVPERAPGWRPPKLWRPKGVVCVVKVRPELFYGERATLELRLLRRLKPRANRLNTGRKERAA